MIDEELEPTLSDVPSLPRSTMRRDIISAYVAAAARVGSWVLVTAIVYRTQGPEIFGVLALFRATLGIATYTMLGIGTATVRLAAASSREAAPVATAEDPSPTPQAGPVVIDYANPINQPDTPPSIRTLLVIYRSAADLANVLASASVVALTIYALMAVYIHALPPVIQSPALTRFILSMGLGTLLRLRSEVEGAVLQVENRISTDNVLIALAEAAWALMVAVCATVMGGSLEAVGWAYCASAVLLFAARRIVLYMQCGTIPSNAATSDHGPALLRIGGLVVLGQAADFLYAPANLILINRFIGASQVATYAPALQIDAALLLLATGVASVLLPKSALAHDRGDHRLLLRYYVRGTFATTLILALAASAVVVASRIIFKLWLNDPASPTRAILPLVLIHTVIGGASGVGRSILIGSGRVGAFTIAALVAGVGNVVMSYLFVTRLQLGLRGIVYSTIIAVTIRCAIWTPWYILRSLRGERPARTNR